MARTKKAAAVMSATAIDRLAYRVANLAVNTADAYSADRYDSWSEAVLYLVMNGRRQDLSRGWTDEEVEAVLRSKWMRWTADASGKAYGFVPASALSRLIAQVDDREVAALVKDTATDAAKVGQVYADVRRKVEAAAAGRK